MRTIDNDGRALFTASVIGLLSIVCGGIVVGLTGNGYFGVIATGLINTVNLYQVSEIGAEAAGRERVDRFAADSFIR